MGPERQYLLDCAVEFGEITPLEAAVFSANTSAAQEFDRLLAQDVLLPPHFLRNTARAYLDAAPLPERMVWALKTAAYTPYALQFLRERVAAVVQTKALRDLGLKEPAPLHLWPELQTEQERGPAPKVFGEVDDIAQPQVCAFVQEQFGQTFERINQDLELVESALAWLAQPGAREQARGIALRLFEACSQQVLPAGPTPVRECQPRQEKRERRHVRGAIKKGLSLLTKFGRHKEAQLLVSGHRAVLSHPDSPFKLELAPYTSGWLTARTRRPSGTAPFEIHLMTKDDVHLGRLCVLFQDTPVLDQLLALSMYVDTGNEMELLQKANWFGVKDESRVRQVLQDKAPQLLDKLPSSAGPAYFSLAGLVDPEEQVWAPYRAPVAQWVEFCMEGLSRRAAALSAAFGPVQALA